MAADLTIKQGNLQPAVTLIARDAVGPVDLDGVTAIFRMRSVLNGAKVVEDVADCAVSIQFTVSGSTLTATSHGLNNGESVTLKTTGALPAGFSAQKEYFVINATANTLQLALVKDGSPISASGGSGTHSLLSGRITYDWQSGDTSTPGTYITETETTIGGKPLSYPNTRQLRVEVISSLA